MPPQSPLEVRSSTPSKGLTVIRMSDGFEIRVQQPFHEIEAAIDAAQRGTSPAIQTRPELAGE
jgi:hypothetical protein